MLFSGDYNRPFFRSIRSQVILRTAGMSASGMNAGSKTCGKKGMAMIVPVETSSNTDMSLVVIRLPGANASHKAMTTRTVAPQSRVVGRCGRVHRDENKEKQDTAEKPVQPENHVVGCSYVVTPAVFPYRESDDERKKQGTYDERSEWSGGGSSRYARYTLVGVRLPGQRSYGAGVIDDAGFSCVLHQYRGQEHLFLECGSTIERCA